MVWYGIESPALLGKGSNLGPAVGPPVQQASILTTKPLDHHVPGMQ